MWGTLFYDVVSWSNRKQTSCIIHTEHAFFTSSLIFGIISAIKYLQSCNPFRCHRQQRRSGRHHKDGQVSILCPSHEEWHRVPQVHIYGLIFFPLGWITFTGATLKKRHFPTSVIHILCNDRFFWETFAFLILKHCHILYSKYKASNAFVVAKVEGELNVFLRRALSHDCM